MKTKRYWKIRKILLNWIFKLKKIRFTLESRRQSSKEYWSFNRLLLERFVSGVIKGIILATILGLLDKLLLSIGVILVINSNILSDVLIGELGVAGVILGLYCSNISSIYSTRYANAPEKIAIAFQYDRLTVKCLNAISSCIIYGTIILVELLMGYDVGWVSAGTLIIWSIVVVISFGITGNRTYQLSDVFRVSDESSKYFSNLDINAISKSVIKGIDTGKRYNSIKAIRGRNYIEIYKKMITEVYAEGHRITPDWLIKQYVAKEEFVYVNTLFDMVKEGVEQAYSLSSFFVEKNMYYEACIMLTRFYEYESKLSNFFKFANQVEKNLNKYHLDSADKWDDSRLAGVEEKFLECKKELPEMLLKCSSAFAIKNWDRREEYPDFLGECYNHIAEDTVEAIVNSDKKQFEKDFEILTKIMLLYQEYIRTDFIKNKDLYRVEYAYYMFTSPIVEWAQIGGLGILWGEFFKDVEWCSIVKEASKIVLNVKEDEEKSTELAAQLIEFASRRNKFLFGIGARDILETKWNQFVENAIRESATIETEYVMFRQEIKTDSKIIKAFCSNFLDMGFTTDPSEVFWVICINPLLPKEKRFHTRFSWEDDLNE